MKTDKIFKKYYSDNHQDRIVHTLIGDKRNGTFVDIGAAWFDEYNNTYFFEKELEWSGIGIEIDPSYNDQWLSRPLTKYLNADALAVDYLKLFKNFNMPHIIDYLSIDIEPPQGTLEVLRKVMSTGYVFNFITFEVDYYRTQDTLIPARNLVKSLGYVLVGKFEIDCGDGDFKHIDDLYVHSSMLNAVTENIHKLEIKD